MAEQTERVRSDADDVMQPRDTKFMRRLIELVRVHNRAMESRATRYQPYTSKERALLRRHIASATPEDELDMARRRFHEFGGDGLFADALKDIVDVVEGCRADLVQSEDT